MLLIAEGMEAGGHIGKLTTMALGSPGCVDAVSIPVIGAGGVADGRGMAAVLMLRSRSCSGGNSFRWLLRNLMHTKTSRDKILKAKDIDTVSFSLSCWTPSSCDQE